MRDEYRRGLFRIMLFTRNKNKNGSRFITPLQVTSTTFVIPAIQAYFCGQFIASFVLFANAGVSLYVHRPVREKTHGIADMIDSFFCVPSWVISNAFYVYITGFPAIPIICALAVAVLRCIYPLFKWRENKRNFLHGLMHIMGSIGTFLLLTQYT